MKPAFDWGAIDWAAVDDWYRRTEAAKREFLRSVGARLVRDYVEAVDTACMRFGRHSFVGRTMDGVFGVIETWCDSAGVIQSMARIASELRRQGYRAAFLPTAMSTRCVRQRRPVIVVPPGSNVDPIALAERLATAGFKGVEGPPHVVKWPPT